MLVLKHAQDVWGLDRAIVRQARLVPSELPGPDGMLALRDHPGVAADALIFIGTRSINQFSYSDVRRFGYLAVRACFREVPQAQEIALTLHGVGFGLDEIECFDAEIAGMLEAIEELSIPGALERIAILELDAGRADRLRKRLAFLLEPRAATRSGETQNRMDEQAYRAAGTDEDREHAFVAMPFDKSFSDCFYYGISGAVRANGLACERMDQQIFTGDIIERLKRQIVTSKLVIADITGGNANVFLEVGFAWGVGKPTVLICKEGSPLPFDVQGHRCIFYDVINELEVTLKSELHVLLASP